jgi:hypothetical protein
LNEDPGCSFPKKGNGKALLFWDLRVSVNPLGRF